MSWSSLFDSLLSPWGALQLCALLVGALLVGRRAPARYLVACGAAPFGALALPALLRLPGVLAGAPFRLEVMSFGALAGLSLGWAWTAPDRPAALDGLAPALGPMVALARLGCFVAGCDFGSVSHVPWAHRYADGLPAALQHQRLGWVAEHAASLPVHPTQLYESALGMVMLLVAWRAPRGRGMSFAAVAATYAAGRLVVELFRGDEGRGAIGLLSMPQLLALAVIAGCAAWWLRDQTPDGVNEVTR